MSRILCQDTIKYPNQEVKICGWVNSLRAHGKIIFIDLRDRSGLAQIVFTPKCQEYDLSQKIRPEWVVEIIGKVQERPKSMENPKMITGKIEIQAKNLKVLAKAKTLPFDIETNGYEINEEKRLKYRYLDLRRQRMKKNLEIRQKVIQYMRKFLTEKEFIEIETPLLTKSTPEGSRDFLVPARLQKGKFYALPQSAQQYKQMLQIAGIEKYFQVARCLRDEDPRGDRQAEHTQLDIEMSFASQEEILILIEKLYIELIKKIFPEKKITQEPFIRMTHKQAMEKYKTDRPDLRKNKKDENELAFAFITDFPMFKMHKKDKKWGAEHHPFSKPQTNDIKEIKNHPEKILARQYDFVLNGQEIGGGSERITDLDILLTVFEVMGHKKQDIKRNFKNYFDAFQYGTPPHGGIANGIDRFLAIALNEPNIREVIAFPKTGDNRDLMMDAPAEVSEKQLKESHIKIRK
ncbi:MAG: amino acid--tRNA ligase-related protein [Patescibacteria group bacterium]|nr:amino acid--tRNA ligase-related protein [Patescibacteria group bacterium]